jgi:hypothetical protein
MIRKKCNIEVTIISHFDDLSSSCEIWLEQNLHFLFSKTNYLWNVFYRRENLNE